MNIDSISSMSFQFANDFGLGDFDVGLVAGLRSVDVWEDGDVSALAAAGLEGACLRWVVDAVL